MNIAINGFGRIGRAAFKIALEKGFNVVAINDLTDSKTLASLLMFDSVYGKYNHNVSAQEHVIVVDGKEYSVFAEKEPVKLPWKDLGVDVVLECTGKFTNNNDCQGHLQAGAKKVIISAPAKDDTTPTYVIGVNEKEYKGETIISNASCTTNCIAPIAKIIEEKFGVSKAMMSTVHAYTADQNLVDGPHKDARRARSAAINIVPTSTGAAIAAAKTVPTLQNKFDGLAIRVPVPVGSLADFTFLFKKTTSVDEVNQVIQETIKNDEVLSKIVLLSRDPIVSSDVVGTTYSTIIDLPLTQVVDGDMVKIIAWYDNEMGYSYRLVEMAEFINR